MEKKTQGQRRTLPKPVKKLFWAGRLALGAAAFVPIFLFMVLFNFKVDCQGYFQGDQELRDVVELMLSGHDVVGAERLNNSQRKIIKTFVHNMEDVPATIALGSSRVMMISSEMLKTDSFYNCAITGADMYDLMGTYYLFEQRGAVPQNIIIGVDPWVFGGEDAVDPRSDKALYAEFLLRDLGIETDFETEDPTMKWEALYSPSYFQGNLTYFLSARGEVVQPQAVEGDVMNQDTEVMRSDGSIVYSRSFPRSRRRPLTPPRWGRQAISSGWNIMKSPRKSALSCSPNLCSICRARASAWYSCFRPITPSPMTTPWKTPSTTAALWPQSR